MHRKLQSTLSALTIFAVGVMAFTAANQLQAQEKKADVNGSWTWSQPGRDGGSPRVSTLKLKAEGDKLTGTLTTPGRQGGDLRSTAIDDGKIKGDEVSFSVTSEFNGHKFTQKYHGKLSGDSIKGKVEFERNGEAQSRDWEA